MPKNYNLLLLLMNYLNFKEISEILPEFHNKNVNYQLGILY